MALPPEEVFTPASLPLREANVYARRTEAESRLRTSIKTERVAIVYGDFGVGKTSTVRKIAQEDRSWDELYFEAKKGKNLSDLLIQFLEKEEYEVIKKSTVGVEGGVGISSFFSFRGKGQTEKERVVTSPTDDKVLELMNARPRLIIVDELHKASDSFKDSMVDFIKTIPNRQLHNIRLILIGTVHQPGELVRIDEGVRRLIHGVPIPPMNEAESSFIVTEGMKKCGLHIDDGLVKKIAQLSGGAPSVVHDLCLYASLAAVDQDKDTITQAELDYALKEVMQGRFAQHEETWMQNIEKQGPTRWRKHIMLAMALIPSELVTTEELSRKLAELLGRERVVAENYSYQMKELQEKRVVSKVETPDRVPGRALWRFVDPSFKNFIKFKIQLDPSLLPNLDGKTMQKP